MNPARLLLAALLGISAAPLWAFPGLKGQSDSPTLAPAGPPVAGKVVEILDGGGYTYLLLDRSGERVWVAAPAMTAAVGEQVVLQPGTEMPEFHSKTLKRTFKNILFTAGPVSGGAPVVPAASGLAVQKAEGKDGRTVAQTHADKESLSGKNVAVRGRVTKVNSGIMNRNWVHLQDGTGDAAKGTHDLLVTTQDLPKAGEIVMFQGTLSANRDFGSGYRYAVVLEKALLKK